MGAHTERTASSVALGQGDGTFVLGSRDDAACHHTNKCRMGGDMDFRVHMTMSVLLDGP